MSEQRITELDMRLSTHEAEAHACKEKCLHHERILLGNGSEGIVAWKRGHETRHEAIERDIDRMIDIGKFVGRSFIAAAVAGFGLIAVRIIEHVFGG